MPVYCKLGDPGMWLMYYPPDKTWYVQPTSAKGSDEGIACLDCISYSCLPENGPKSKWHVLDNDDFQIQAAVKISIATPQQIQQVRDEIAAAAVVLAASVAADGHKVLLQFKFDLAFTYLMVKLMKLFYFFYLINY